MVSNKMNVKAVLRDYSKEFRTRDLPQERTIKTCFEKWRRTGSVADDRESRKTATKSIDNEETRALVDEFFTAEPNASVRVAAQRLNISKTSLFRIMKELELSAYKIQYLQDFNPDHEERRFEFAQSMIEKLHQKEINPHKIWFSDESWFTLEGGLNKQNYRFCGKVKPDGFLTRNLHPKKILVWCAFSAEKIKKNHCN
ncbi:uncharacterized protein LOC128391202 [Panonychus citri]|uniref:uncharacterized protein LOC128391202 n=1 Tax=Panonychus citri TaxID=50023 RepID=UPI00230707A4|nr:uncharacterized protein LOC128391202 [Panonychus citri]